MGKAVIYAGIIVGVAAISGIMVFATQSQQDRIPPEAIAAPANVEGSFTSPSGMGAELNKEKWHDDPFADEAAQIRANIQSGG